MLAVFSSKDLLFVSAAGLTLYVMSLKGNFFYSGNLRLLGRNDDGVKGSNR